MIKTYEVLDSNDLYIGKETAPRFLFRTDGAQPILSYEKITTTGSSDVADPNKAVTLITSGGAHTVTLADGSFAGQTKKIIISDVTAGTITLTPANFADGTSLTMAEILDYVELLWDGTNWNIVTGAGLAII